MSNKGTIKINPHTLMDIASKKHLESLAKFQCQRHDLCFLTEAGIDKNLHFEILFSGVKTYVSTL